MDPQMLVPLLIAVSAAVGVWALFMMFANKKEQSAERLERYGRVGRSDQGPSALKGTEKLQELLEKTAPAFARPLMPQSAEEHSSIKVTLANAGWRSENAVVVYTGIRFGALLFGLLLASTFVLPVYGLTRNGLLYSFMLAGLFFYVPGIVLWWRRRKRQEQIFLGLPDALDLMVVCVEAGLGLDAAMRKVCDEMGQTFPVVAEEFSLCNFQMQMGRPRREVLHDLGVRTGVDDMKSLSAILIQADRFGSSIAQALRVQSDSMRVRRRQLAEERAAKVAVQLLLPLILFIFPAIFIVLVGPAGLKVYDTLVAKK